MSKNKHQNQAGSFVVARNGFRKYTSVLTTALLAVIFVSGLGLVLFKQSNKPPHTEVAQIAITDQLPGWWYQQYYGKSVCEIETCKPESDSDRDGLNNAQEFYYHTDPGNGHTAEDQMDDGDLVAHGFDPSKPGRMTFDQVMSDDNILGESLVFNQDIKQLINESIDPNKVVLPEISDAELNLVGDNSKESLIQYFTDTKQIFENYFPQNSGSSIEDAVNTNNEDAVNGYGMKFIQAVGDLKQVPVPDDFVQLHKYTIAFLQLLPDVINSPSQEILNDQYNVEANAWYDKTQAAFALYQKMNLEGNRLTNKYQNAQ